MEGRVDTGSAASPSPVRRDATRPSANAQSVPTRSDCASSTRNPGGDGASARGSSKRIQLSSAIARVLGSSTTRAHPGERSKSAAGSRPVTLGFDTASIVKRLPKPSRKGPSGPSPGCMRFGTLAAGIHRRGQVFAIAGDASVTGPSSKPNQP